MKIEILLLLFSITSFSQNQPIEADRPDQTETPSIVPVGMYQVESGFSYQKYEERNEDFTLPSTLWKYGVSKSIELRMITEFISEKNYEKKTNGFLPCAVGFKINLFDENKWLPKTSLISHVTLKNCASANFKNDYYVPDFRFTMQHTLGKNHTLGYNLGVEWDGFTKQSMLLYTATTGYSLNEKLGCYIEIFGFATQKETASHNFDCGFTYLINNNLMLDISSGIGITINAPQHYFALGITFRI
ncbi:MAG: transporter [Flavobacterium sp.]